MEIKRLLLLLALPLSVTSCTPYRNVSYLQNPKTVSGFEETLLLYDVKVMLKGLLSTAVNTTDPKAAIPFNSTVQTPINVTLANISTTTQPTIQRCLINNKGGIGSPVVSHSEVGGLTKNEAEDSIRERLKPYLKESPIVTVRMANYEISVLGEVAHPGSFTIGNEKVNILEALAMAGDMTTYSTRDNVRLIRGDVSGKRKVINLNLSSTEAATSPYYYLRQNDIIYMTPNKAKARGSDIDSNTTPWISSFSILVSIVGLLVNISKQLKVES